MSSESKVQNYRVLCVCVCVYGALYFIDVDVIRGDSLLVGRLIVRDMMISMTISRTMATIIGGIAR